MKKKILSILIACTMAITTLVMPMAARADGDVEETITVTYYPANYATRHTIYSAKLATGNNNIQNNPISVNVETFHSDFRRSDFMSLLTQYTIPNPDAVTKVTLSIPKIQLWKDSATHEDKRMGMGIYYSTENSPEDFPTDGIYYTEGTQANPTNPVGGEDAVAVNQLCLDWQSIIYSHNNSKDLIPTVNGAAFGLELPETSSKGIYDIENFDITSSVLSDIKNEKNAEKNESYFSIVYSSKGLESNGK